MTIVFRKESTRLLQLEVVWWSGCDEKPVYKFTEEWRDLFGKLVNRRCLLRRARYSQEGIRFQYSNENE